MTQPPPDATSRPDRRARLELLSQHSRRPAGRRAQLFILAVASLGFAVGATFAVRAFPHTSRFACTSYSTGSFDRIADLVVVGMAAGS